MFMLAVALVVGYFVIQSTGYAVHKALHHPALGKIHDTHDVHHKLMYPPEDYLDTGKYREVPDNAQPFKYYAAAAVPLVAAVFIFLPLTIAISLAVELAVVAWANDWLHQKMHIKGYWLERYTWFHHLRALHWHHHVDDSKNIGIFSWFTDKILGTYEEATTRPSYLPSLKPELHLIPMDEILTHMVDEPELEEPKEEVQLELLQG
jgi:hypothetical protein